ncbi:MAG TPA: carboxypeptidase-like regulatory domain-containing protein [Gemmataceae bacterium]|nr:carboxypeptidase-like regulatory domain-containing protein [Gemmataceae bacterium]
MCWLAVDQRPGRCLVLVATLTCLLGVGCTGQPSQKPCYPVHGSVRVKGKPAVGALVTFYPKDNSDNTAPTAAGTTDANGGFSLSTYMQDDGAPAGDYKVRITLQTEQFGRRTPMRKGPPRKGPPMKATQPPASRFEAHVSEGPNDLAPFEIK